MDAIYAEWRRAVKVQSALYGLMCVSTVLGLYFYQRRQETFARREAESISALEDSELRYRRIVDTANEGIWMLGEDAMTSFVNERMADMLGYRAEEMIGQPASAFMFDEDVADHYSRMENRLRGLSEHYERRYRHKNGRTVWTIASAVPIFEAGHNFKGSFAMFTDITERKKAEEKLRKREWQLIESQRVAHLGSWDLNLVSEELEWSNETYRLFDRSPEDFVPSFNEFARLVHPGDHATMETNFFRALESDANPYHVAVRIINDSGREWVMEAFGVVRRDPSGKALSIFGTAQDITERKKAEEQVQQSLHEKETLLRELYHRTKNNMQVIISLLNLQSGSIDDKKTMQILEDTKNRIQSMALVHEKLYKAKNLSQVYLGDYIKDLADALMESHNGGNDQISLQRGR